jgi:hypothetical protein
MERLKGLAAAAWLGSSFPASDFQLMSGGLPSEREIDCIDAGLGNPSAVYLAAFKNICQRKTAYFHRFSWFFWIFTGNLAEFSGFHRVLSG